MFLRSESLFALNVGVIEFDRSISTKDGDENFDFFSFWVDLFDFSGVVGKWAFNNADNFTFLEADGWGFFALFEVIDDALDFVIFKRNRSVAASEESGYSAGAFYNLKRFVCQVHPNQNIAREDLLLDFYSFTISLADLLFSWNKDIEDIELPKLFDLCLSFKQIGDFVFVTRDCVDGVPGSGHSLSSSQQELEDSFDPDRE